MFMKEVATRFICDSCKKSSEHIPSGYPYDNGWHYLYDVNIQVPRENKNGNKCQRVMARDKHFCSSSCLEQFIVALCAEDDDGEVML